MTTSLASLGRGLETSGTWHSDGFAIRVPLKVNLTVGTSIARRSSIPQGSSNSIFGARLQVKAIPAKKSLACTSRRSSHFPKVNGSWIHFGMLRRTSTTSNQGSLWHFEHALNPHLQRRSRRRRKSVLGLWKRQSIGRTRDGKAKVGSIGKNQIQTSRRRTRTTPRMSEALWRSPYQAISQKGSMSSRRRRCWGLCQSAQQKNQGGLRKFEQCQRSRRPRKRLRFFWRPSPKPSLRRNQGLSGYQCWFSTEAWWEA